MNSYKGKHLIGPDLWFRGLVHYHHGRMHGGDQADMVLERELGDLQPAGSTAAQRDYEPLTWLEQLLSAKCLFPGLFGCSPFPCLRDWWIA